MLSLFEQSELADLIIKVENNERMEFKDGVRLIRSKDVLALGYMANIVRERKHGNKTYFRGSENINNDLQVSFKTMAEIEHALSVYPFNSHMFYGKGLTFEEQIDRLLQLREEQDNSRRFLTFIPLPVYTQDIELDGNMGTDSTTGFEDLRILAVSRILLDNIDHIKTFWIILGPKLAQVSLNFGVDDLDGIVKMNLDVDESWPVMHKNALISLIKKAGRTPIERDSNYRVLKVYEA